MRSVLIPILSAGLFLAVGCEKEETKIDAKAFLEQVEGGSTAFETEKEGSREFTVDVGPFDGTDPRSGKYYPNLVVISMKVSGQMAGAALYQIPKGTEIGNSFTLKGEWADLAGFYTGDPEDAGAATPMAMDVLPAAGMGQMPVGLAMVFEGKMYLSTNLEFSKDGDVHQLTEINFIHINAMTGQLNPEDAVVLKF